MGPSYRLLVRKLHFSPAGNTLTNRLFRYKDLRRLSEMAKAPQQRSLLDVHESIRPMADYQLENL